MSLLEQLIALQKMMGLSDRKFAKTLGITDSLWTMTRLGIRPIRYEVLRGVATAFPENHAVQQAVLAHLRGEKAQRQAVA